MYTHIKNYLLSMFSSNIITQVTHKHLHIICPPIYFFSFVPFGGDSKLVVAGTGACATDATLFFLAHTEQYPVTASP